MNAPAAAPRVPPQLWWWVVASALLLALRKPWALHTPQFWAEDGSIFMVQDGQLGLAAFLTPYNGYLHLLPRLVAWLASHTVDVAWWPAVYNGFAYAAHVAVCARLLSPRVRLPAKPGLMLALVVLPGSGEVLINLTNLQWIAAFLLVLQLFTEPPARSWARLGDLTILAAVALSGPFGLVLAPLYAVRAWRDRHPQAWVDCGVLAACALVQGVLLFRAGTSINSVSAPFFPRMLLSMLGSRLVVWTCFGPPAVYALPSWAHAAIGTVFLTALAGWALRPDPRRPVRAMLVATFALASAACMYRVRADTWPAENLAVADRYFFLPRVLVVWLVVLECQATNPVVARLARLLCLSGALLHLPHYVLPAPPDYQWARHCDPIRRGVPADILTLPEGWWIEYPGRPGRS